MTICFEFTNIDKPFYYDPDPKKYKHTIYSYLVNDVSIDDRTIGGTEYDLEERGERIITLLKNKFKSIKIIKIDRPDLGEYRSAKFFYFTNRSDEAYFTLWSNAGINA